MISILVPFKSFGQADRDANWSWLKHRLETLHPTWEICVGESEQPFNRGKAINEAASKAKGDVFYICDADCFVYPEQAIEAANLALHAPGIVIAGSTWIAMEMAPSVQVRTGSPNPRFANLPDSWCVFENSVSACLAIARSGFEAVGGFPEEFEGWGFEDCAMWYKCETFLAVGRRIPGNMYHLWHPTARNPEDENYMRNEARCNVYGAANRDVEAMRAVMG